MRATILILVADPVRLDQLVVSDATVLVPEVLVCRQLVPIDFVLVLYWRRFLLHFDDAQSSPQVSR